MVRTLCYKYLKSLHGFLCGELPAESAESRWTYIIDHATDVNIGGSGTEMTRRFQIRMIIHRNGILAAKNDCMDFMYNCWAPNDCWYVSKVSVNRASTIFGIASWKFQMVSLQRSFKIKLWPACLFKNRFDNVASMS